MKIRLVGFLLMFIGGVFSAVGLYMAILFRDGLGPDSISSSGLLALERTLQGLSPLTLASLLVLVFGAAIVWRRR